MISVVQSKTCRQIRQPPTNHIMQSGGWELKGVTEFPHPNVFNIHLLLVDVTSLAGSTQCKS